MFDLVVYVIIEWVVIGREKVGWVENDFGIKVEFVLVKYYYFGIVWIVEGVN